MALITTQEDPTKKDASYYKKMRDSLYNKSKFYEDLYNKTEDETERNKLLDSIAIILVFYFFLTISFSLTQSYCFFHIYI